MLRRSYLKLIAVIFSVMTLIVAFFLFIHIEWDIYRKSYSILSSVLEFISFVFFFSVAIILILLFRTLNEEQFAQQRASQMNILIDQSLDAIIGLDSEFRISGWNKGAENLFGFTAQEVIGKVPASTVTNEFVESNRAQIMEQLLKNGYWSEEFWFLNKYRKDIFIWVSISAVKDDAGVQTGFLLLARDKTRSKEAEDAIRHEAFLMRNLSDAVITTDLDFRIKTWNHIAAKLYGWNEEEVIGKTTMEVLTPRYKFDRNEFLKRFFEKGDLTFDGIHHTKDGKELHIQTSASIIRDEAGRNLEILIVLRDTTELIRSRDELKLFNESLTQQVKEKTLELTNVFERVHDAFIALDKNWNYTYVNKKAAELHRKPVQELIGKCIWEIDPASVNSCFYNALKTAMETQQSARVQCHYTITGQWFENLIYPSPEGLSVYYHEITDQKTAEFDLIKSEAQYRTLVENASESIVIAEPDGTYIEANNQVCSLLGYSKEELSKINLFSLFVMSENDPPIRMPEILEGKTIIMERVIRKKDGNLITLELSSKLLPDNRILSMARDITEKNEMQRNLKENEATFRHLFEASADAIMLLADGLFVDCNRHTLEMLGFTSKQEIIGLSPSQISPEKQPDGTPSVDMVRIHVDKALQEGRHLFEWMHKHTDGHGIPVEVLLTPIKLRGKDFVYASCRDITERKKADRLIRENEEKYRLLSDTARDIIVSYDLSFKITHVNKVGLNIFGLTLENAVGRNVKEFMSLEVSGELDDRLQYWIDNATDDKPRLFEFEVLDKDGNKLILEASTSLMRSEENAIGFISICRDITARRRYEEDLRLKEKAIETSISGIGMTDINGNISYVNASICKMWGCTDPAQLLGKNLRDVFEGDRVLQSIQELQTKGYSEGEDTGRRIDGSLFPVFYSANVLFDKDGKPTAMFGSFLDISEQKMAETKIRESEASYRALFENSIDGVIIGDGHGRNLSVNQAICDMLGYTQTELCNLPRERILMPDDMHSLIRLLKERDDKGRSFGELIFRHKDGHPVTTLVSTSEFRDFYGKKLVSVIVHNIEARRKAEQDLKEKLIHIQLLAELAVALSQAQNMDEIYMLALHALKGIINADRVAMLLYDEHSVMRFVASYGISDEYKEKAEGHSPWQRDTKDPQPILVNDAIREPSLLKLLPFIKAEGISALGFVPLLKKGKLMGKFMIYFNEVHEFTDEEIHLAQAIARNISFAIDEKETDISLRASELKYKSLFEKNPIPMWMLSFDEQHHIIDVNEAAVREYGYSRDEFIKMTILDFYNEADAQSIKEDFKIDVNEILTRGVWSSKRKDGSLINVEVYVQDVVLEGKKVRLALCNNVTDKLKAEHDLKESLSQVRELASHLQGIREEERISIAREIHDELGQQLTGLKLEIGSIFRHKEMNEEESIKRQQEAFALLDTAIVTVRNLATRLRPPVLDDLGLKEALLWQSKEFEKRSGILSDFSSNTEAIGLSSSVVTSVFRIYQECLTNVSRHSGADMVETSLQQEQNEMKLTIRDNGRGFDIDKIRDKKTLGILGMKERTQMIGGHYDIVSTIGKGTQVTISFPC